MRIYRKVALAVTNAFLAACLMISLIAGCSSTTAESKLREQTFAMYQVRDITTSEAEKADLKSLPLWDEPMITERDISSYDWKEHTVYLEKSSIEKMPAGARLGGRPISPTSSTATGNDTEPPTYVPLDGIPVVIVANGERMYLATLLRPASSYMAPAIPNIFFMSDRLSIGPVSVSKPGVVQQDPRGDKRIRDALKKAGKLKE